MSEGSKLRRAIYARMEEMSFRSGAALAAAVLAVTGLGIALTLTLGGGHGAAAAPRTTPASTIPTVGGAAAIGLGAALAAGQRLAQPGSAPTGPGRGRRAPARGDTDSVPARFPGHVVSLADAPDVPAVVLPLPARGLCASALPAARWWWPGAP